MGWSFACDTKHGKVDEVARLVSWQKSADAVWTLVDHRVVRNHLWMVVKHTKTGEVEPALYLLQPGWPQHGWGHKSVSHTDQCDMPLSLLSMLPPTQDARQNEWREAVRQHHRAVAEQRIRSRTIAVGDKFVWNEGRLVVQAIHPGGKHFSVVYEIERNGEWWGCNQYRAKRSVLAKLPAFEDPKTPEAHQAGSQKEDDVRAEEDQQLLFA